MAKITQDMPLADNDSWPLNEDGVWIDLRGKPRERPGPVLFLDRDGVIIFDAVYVGDPADVAILPDAARMIATANRMEIPVAVVTNQSGIDRGYFGWSDFDGVMKRIADELASRGAHLDAVAACPFHPDFTPGYGAMHDGWRKPGAMMILTLAKELNADPSSSWMVGDQESDILAAAAAGLGHALLLSDAGGDSRAAPVGPSGTKIVTGNLAGFLDSGTGLFASAKTR